MAALEGKERERLVALLGMTGSDGDGEALNAARLANKFLKDRKMTWSEVIGTIVIVEKEVVKAPSKSAKNKDHQLLAQEILDRVGMRLTNKEHSFVSDMINWNVPTERQLDWLKTIYDRYL